MSATRFIKARESRRSSQPSSGIVDREGTPEETARLAAFVKIWGAFCLVGVVLNLGGPTWFGWDPGCAMAGAGLDGALLGISVLFYVVLRRSGLAWRRKLDLGLVYVAIACLAIAMGQASRPFIGVSPVAILILLFPLFVPTSIPRALVTAMVGASMLPAAYLITGALDPSVEITAMDKVSFGFTYFIASLTVVPAKIVRHMQRDLRHAKQLGSYELVERIGSGGMGEVWRAKHRMLRRPAAIKLIKTEALGGASSQASIRTVERFEREAQATAMLESPHSVELYDFGVSADGALFHVMELLHGVDLESLVRKHGPMPPERVVHVLLGICDSLDDAHRRGLIHRDIKPANVYLARKGRRVDWVKVLDFGLVKGRKEAVAGEVNATAEGEIAGTPAYIAPEMVTGEALDGRADLYALGCLAYFLLTGSLVFDAENPMKMAIAHATEAPRPPSKRGVRVPRELEAIVMECLEKDRDNRPSCALSLAEQLESIAFEEEWSASRARSWWAENLREELGSDEQLLADAAE